MNLAQTEESESTLRRLGISKLYEAENRAELG